MRAQHAPQYNARSVPAKTPAKFLRPLALVPVIGSILLAPMGTAEASRSATAPVQAGAIADTWTQSFLSWMELLLRIMNSDPAPRPNPKLLPADWAAQLNDSYSAKGIRPGLSEQDRASAQNAIAEASRLISSHPESFPDDLAARTQFTLQSMSLDLHSNP